MYQNNEKKQCALHLADVKTNLKLITVILLFEIFIMLEWSRHMINMLFYKHVEILLIISIDVIILVPNIKNKLYISYLYFINMVI